MLVISQWKLVQVLTLHLTHQLNQNFSGGTDDYAVTAGELETAYGEFEDTESVDVNLILGGRGGGGW